MTDSAEHFINAFPAMYNDLYRYLAYRIPNRSDAEDAVANTAFLAWKNIQQHDADRGSIEEWVMGIAKNQVRMYWRNRKLHCSLAEIEHLFAGEARPIDHTVNDQITIERIFTELDNEQKALLALHFIDGIPYKDIANILTGTPAQFRKKVSRTIGAIRNRFSFFVE